MEPAGVSGEDARRSLSGPVAINMRGQVLEHWTVLRQSWSRRSRVHWICRCTCGAEQTIGGTELRSMDRRGPVPCKACGQGSAQSGEAAA